MFDTRDSSHRSESVPSCINNTVPHIEQFYIIGKQLGSGTSGQVHHCINRQTGLHYAVKIIDTKKFAMKAGLSMKDLKQEAAMMKDLDHVGIIF